MREWKIHRVNSFFLLIIIGILWTAHVMAYDIEGTAKNRDGEPAAKIGILLYDMIYEKEPPHFSTSDTNGNFSFSVSDRPGLYRLVAHNDDRKWEKLIPYQKEDLGRVLLEEPYDKWAGLKSLLKTFLGPLIAFLLGFFSRELQDLIKRGKFRKDISSMHEKTLMNFFYELAKMKDISRFDESAYTAFYSKFIDMKNQFKSLSSFTWAAERITPEFYLKIQNKLSTIEEIERSFPFDPQRSYQDKLSFLKDHHKKENWPPYAADHTHFMTLLEKLEEPLG